MCSSIFFFFQAEDGIRDVAVTGVQTCALPILVAMRPSEYRVARTATISAPAPAVFAQVNDFHKWEAWNPWAKLDPAMKQTYEGAPAGTRAIYTWTRNNQVGEGRMTLTESRPNEPIRINLEL